MKEEIRNYIQSFLEINGWQAPGVVFATRYVRFRLRRSVLKRR